MDINKDPMRDKEEAKARMCVKFEEYVNGDDLLLAILRNDELTLTEYRAIDSRIAEFNAKIEQDVDRADAKQLREMVASYQRPAGV